MSALPQSLHQGLSFSQYGQQQDPLRPVQVVVLEEIPTSPSNTFGTPFPYQPLATSFNFNAYLDDSGAWSYVDNSQVAFQIRMAGNFDPGSATSLTINFAPAGPNPIPWQIVAAIDAIGSATGAFVPTGTIIMWISVTPPVGYLFCDGSAHSRTTFARLFAIIGTKFGPGDGATTFNIPNMVGLFVQGANSTFTVGTTGGAAAASVTLATANLPSHTHPAAAGTFVEVSAGGSSLNVGAVVKTTDANTGAQGSGTAVSVPTVPPFIQFAYLIKT